MELNLEQVRGQIDAIDDQLVALYLQRMQLVGQVAQCKSAAGTPINAPMREQAVIYRLTQGLQPDMQLYIKDLYDCIFTDSKSYQSRLLGQTSHTAQRLQQIKDEGQPTFPVSASIACQGVMGSNSHTAAGKLFPIGDVSFFRSFEGVFGAVAKGMCEYGVLPIENSTAGSVNEVYDLMKKYDFHIVKAVRLKIDHCLAAKAGVRMEDVRRVASHPQALSQCAAIIKQHGWSAEAAENTAVAAKQLATQGDDHTAVLCSEDCAKLYGLHILQRAVQDSDANYTRFICIGKRLQVFAGSTKISVMTTLPHQPGSLHNTLGRFASIGLDLTKLESRPLPNAPFQFMFYFDFDGNVFDDKIIALIAELENSTDDFTFLGSYQEMV